LVVHPDTSGWFHTSGFGSTFFVSIFVITIFYLVRNYRELARTRDVAALGNAGIPLVMLAVGLRWTSSLTAHVLVRRISESAFETMLYLDAIVAVTLCYALVARAILAHQLF